MDSLNRTKGMKGKQYVVIVAGGRGLRMGTDMPKQFLLLHGKPVLFYTLRAFLEALPEALIILVLPEQQIDYARILLTPLIKLDRIKFTTGGDTRYTSVQNGLSLIREQMKEGEDPIIFVHDGVRPFVSGNLIWRCLHQAELKGSAIPAIPVADSVRKVTADYSEPVDRSSLRIIQTPQTFKASVLLPAMMQPYREAFTDEATVVESFGEKTYLTEGEKSNIKITTPEDMAVGAVFAKAKTDL
jgi:2-C-methyl-D-erythritol 4-phosphate cytidylyltransferase